ncbi:MAG: bifunctional diaminohydroxyphosphoribosylaminopyrimidine deaminase/5-amino-6-(5-phosphoribosylamino)uracil reductase RibD [Pseudobdellovibrionaceae bacterium]
MTAEQSMQMAMQEAAKGAPYVSPNPRVGAVVLDSEGNFLASGYHEIYGGPHAEVNALRNLSPEKLKGATVFVTLEPCAHEGKTPSCAQMMAKLPLKKAVYGLLDPNPLVAGKGAQILRDAGIETEVFSETHPEFKEQLEETCEVFLWNFRQNKVFVSLKIAQSLDGQIGLKNGESKWITNEKSREFAHYLRACHDATLVGRGTVAADNPALNVRHPHIRKNNTAVVIDSRGSLLREASRLQITHSHSAENLLWCVSENQFEHLEAYTTTILKIREGQGGSLDLSDLLQKLWYQGIRSVMIEGGAKTASEFLSAGLVNRLYLFQAPIIIGDKSGRSWTEAFGISDMKQRLVLKNPTTMSFGGDILITGLLC